MRLDETCKPEVTDPKDDDGDVEEKEAKAKGRIWDVARDEPRKGVFRGLQCGGRQENSLGTIRSISQSLYTNTGWSVRSLG